jgi:hypothetical protein
VLLVFVDYGNTGISKDQAFAALRAAEETANRWHERFAAAHGLKTPLITLHATPAFLAAPPRSGEFLTSAEILSGTGLRTADFDITAQVDLDSAATLSRKSGGLGWTLFGGCRPEGSQKVNFYMTAQSAGELVGDIAGSLFDHELSHVMGWMHWWPNGDGGLNSQSIWNNENSCFAFLFFGWMDVDGDGIIEILDPNPYGR